MSCPLGIEFEGDISCTFLLFAGLAGLHFAFVRTAETTTTSASARVKYMSDGHKGWSWENRTKQNRVVPPKPITNNYNKKNHVPVNWWFAPPVQLGSAVDGIVLHLRSAIGHLNMATESYEGRTFGMISKSSTYYKPCFASPKGMSRGSSFIRVSCFYYTGVAFFFFCRIFYFSLCLRITFFKKKEKKKCTRENKR